MEISALVNGKRCSIQQNDVRDLLEHLALILLRNYKYQHPIVIQENMQQLLFLALEGIDLSELKTIAEHKEKLSLKRKIRIFMKRISSFKDKEDLIRKIYDSLLSLEGLSNLPGFGFSNKFGDRLVGNPEKQSVV
jgi:hypothetical protein